MQQQRPRSGAYSRRRPAGNRNQRPTRKKPTNTINPSRFINKAITPEADVPYVPTHTFHDFGLDERIVKNLDYLKFTKPSEIQDRCIPLTLAGTDTIGLANTGTGKTAAFLLPIIDKLLANRELVSVLILAPTRELAQQIDEEFRRFSSGMKLYSTLAVGGQNIGRQIHQIQRGPHVIIGTPGRIKDLINRRVLRLSTVTTFVLDEADRMCDMGFEKDIRTIEAELSKQRQTLCYSATMTRSVQSIMEEFMVTPETVSVVKQATNDHIEQDVVHFENKDHKVEMLMSILARDEVEKVVVFGETKFGVQRLSDAISKSGIPSEAIHGNKSQSQRERALKMFKDKNNNINVLVATDVAARGLDIPDVTHVINYDIPQAYDDYIHRIGRTGRAGKSGTALTFIQKR